MTAYSNNESREYGKNGADGLWIPAAVSVVCAVLTKAVYDIVGEIAYLYGDAVFGLEGFGRDIFVSAVIATAVFLMYLLICLLSGRFLFKSFSLLPALSVLSLTSFGKVLAVIESMFKISPCSREDVHRIHNLLMYISLALAVALTLLCVIILVKRKFDGVGDETTVPVWIFGAVTVLLNIFYCIGLWKSETANTGNLIMFFGSIAADACKIALMYYVIIKGKDLKNRKPAVTACFAVLVVSLLFSVYDSGFVPVDFLQRIDGAFFFG